MPSDSEVRAVADPLPVGARSPSEEPGSSFAPTFIEEDVVVKVQDLTVEFRTTKERNPTIKRTIAELGRKKRKQTVTALEDISFDVERGSIFGVIGHNGAGKTTMFRALAGIYPPTRGRIDIHGRLTPLLSLGVGFNPELTGRDNILLGGLANGFTLDQIKDRRDTIVDFCGIGEAIDYPMKTYSKGMGGRLAFSIAAHLDPDILLIDEALAAGDARFKQKSAEALTNLCMNDATVLVISHGMGIIKQLADRALWIEAGRMMQLGPAEEVVEAYLIHEGHKSVEEAQRSRNPVVDVDSLTASEAAMEDF